MGTISQEKIEVVNKVYNELKNLGVLVNEPISEEVGESIEYTFFVPRKMKRFGVVIYFELDNLEDYFMDDFVSYFSFDKELELLDVINNL